MTQDQWGGKRRRQVHDNLSVAAQALPWSLLENVHCRGRGLESGLRRSRADTRPHPSSPGNEGVPKGTLGSKGTEPAASSRCVHACDGACPL